MMQDEPTTNTYGADEGLVVPNKQGWKFVLEDFAWRALFPLSVTGGHWWVAALGGPSESATRYAYQPEWFRHAALTEMGHVARRGPILWSSHTCLMHAPLHLSLREATRLPGWWRRSGVALEGSGNPFTDGGTGGQADVGDARMSSVRQEVNAWLQELDRQGVLGTALVVVLSDHGPRGAWVPTDRTEHVQLAVFSAGPQADQTIRAPVSLVDVAQTVREHLGLPLIDGPAKPLPSREHGERRLVGRVDAPTLGSAGIELEKVTATEVSRTIAFNHDGTYTFAPEFVKRVAASELAATSRGGVIRFVDRM